MSDILDTLRPALADRYLIERELGAGGMATVYLVRDVKHDRQVALKVLRPELAAVLGAERFLAEIRITARLDHPHILTLIDSGDGGTPRHVYGGRPRGSSGRQGCVESRRQNALLQIARRARANVVLVGSIGGWRAEVADTFR